MDMKLRMVWFSLAILLLLFAAYSFVIQLATPTVDPNLSTFTTRLSKAFIAILISSALFIYLKITHD